MPTYFNINYEFDRDSVHTRIAEQLRKDTAGYVCVADGVILSIANRDPEYLDVVNGSMFSICDSSYVPLYIKWIYGRDYEQYCGSQIFMDIISSCKYRMAFMGTSPKTIRGLKENLKKVNPDVGAMIFYDLPYRDVEDFDYPAIADMINRDGTDIIWVALGAPKQEIFMNLLRPHLNRGVIIAVGAAFKFYSGVDTSRAPQWMIRHHMEFIHRIMCEPQKQLRRCWSIVSILPVLFFQEWKRKQIAKR